LAGKALDIPLIVSEHYPEKLGTTVAELDISHAVMKYPKTKFSMVVPEIAAYLNGLKDVEDVFLFGLEAHICLEQSAMDILSLNKFNCHIVADCILSRTKEDRAFALNRLDRMGCIITSSENVLFKLIRDKNHPQFNVIRDLVATPSEFPYNKL
jgi:nicotinamidase-related amidase